MSRTTTLIAVALSAICFACGDSEGDEHGDHAHDTESLKATLAAKSDNTTLKGTATFSGEAGKVQVKVDVTGAPPASTACTSTRPVIAAQRMR